MSCTVIAVPFALMHLMGILVTTAVASKAASSISSNIADRLNEKLDYNEQENCDDTHIITVNDIVEKTYETPFMDKEILLKTLDEHGFQNVKEDLNGIIYGKFETFGVTFEKPAEDKPYNLKITCNKSDNSDEKINDIASEYTMNVQEAAYLSITEKLKENNMQIEEEVVEDDNTIVLTINLE